MLKDDSFKQRKEVPLPQRRMHNYLMTKEKRNQAGLGILSLSEQSDYTTVIRSNSSNENINAVQDSDIANHGKHWFVMRDLKRSNAKMPAYKMLKREQIELFTPMKQVYTIKQGKRICEEVPFIQDLLFVHSTSEILDPIVEKNPTLQYRYIRGGKYREALTIADADMEKFIYAVRNCNSLRYYRPDEISPAMFGRKIRIIGGVLDHYEGYLLKGSKNKSLLIELPGFLSAGVRISSEFIQFI